MTSVIAKPHLPNRKFIFRLLSASWQGSSDDPRTVRDRIRTKNLSVNKHLNYMLTYDLDRR